MSEQNALTVTILDREYRVACPRGQEEQLTEAANTLNRKMQEIRETGKVFGIERIAVMAALNLTHEVIQAKPSNAVDHAVMKRLNDKLDIVLPSKEQDLLDLDFDD